MRNGDDHDFTVRRIQFLDSGVVEVFGIRCDVSVEFNTFVFLLGLFNLLLDDNIDCRQVILNLDFLIFFVEIGNHFGDLLDRDHLADFSVKDGLEDVVLDILGNVDVKSSSEDAVDLGLVDELVTDSSKVLEEVLGDIDFVLLLVVGVGAEPFP